MTEGLVTQRALGVKPLILEELVEEAQDASWTPPLRGVLGPENPLHSRETTSLLSWRKWPFSGKSGHLCFDCCLRNLVLDEHKKIDGWIKKNNCI